MEFDQQNRPACIYPKRDLSAATSIGGLTHFDGSPDLDKYYYDPDSGMLFFYVAQDEANAFGPSPLGSCTGDEETDDEYCPSLKEGESYYGCPAQGCTVYVVRMDDDTYQPGESMCDPYPTYAQQAPENENQLVYVESPGEVVVQVPVPDERFPHNEPLFDPHCPINEAPTSATLP